VEKSRKENDSIGIPERSDGTHIEVTGDLIEVSGPVSGKGIAVGKDAVSVTDVTGDVIIDQRRYDVAPRVIVGAAGVVLITFALIAYLVIASSPSQSPTATPPPPMPTATPPRFRIPDLEGTKVFALAETKDGEIWCGTESYGVYVLVDEEVKEHYTSKDGLASDDVYAIYIDGAGRLYLATQNGLSVYDEGSWANHLDGKTLNDIVVRERNDGPLEVWASLWNEGVCVLTFADSSLEREVTTCPTLYDKSNQLSSNIVEALAVQRSSVIWIATQQGVSRFDGREWFGPYGQRDGLSADHVTALLVNQADEVIWAATQQGIDQFTGKRWEPVHTSPCPWAGKLVLSLASSPEGDLWIGTDGGGLAVYEQEGYFTPLYNSSDFVVNLPGNRVYDILCASDGKIWVATDRGVAWLDH